MATRTATWLADARRLSTEATRCSVQAEAALSRARAVGVADLSPLLDTLVDAYRAEVYAIDGVLDYAPEDELEALQRDYERALVRFHAATDQALAARREKRAR